MAEHDDRRRHPRNAAKIPVDYSSVDAFFSEFSSNINEGGMFIEMEETPGIGEQVQVQFRVPGEPKPVRVSGRIAWVSDGKDGSPAGAGVEFMDLSFEARDTINRIVRTLRS